jgi:hypothetical protein
MRGQLCNLAETKASKRRNTIQWQRLCALGDAVCVARLVQAFSGESRPDARALPFRQLHSNCVGARGGVAARDATALHGAMKWPPVSVVLCIARQVSASRRAIPAQKRLVYAGRGGVFAGWEWTRVRRRL